MNQPERFALFASRAEIEDFFGQKMESPGVYSPHYNIAPAHPALTLCRLDGDIRYERIRWGLAPEREQDQRHCVSVEEASDNISQGIWRPAVIPVSGYYLWKRKGKRSDQPFFVRLLSEPVMAIAAIARPDRTGSSPEGIAMVRVQASHLIAPLTDEMPLQLDRLLSARWLAGELPIRELESEAEGLYTVVDMSVLRVSKKVNDLEKNNRELIQPLPK